MDKKSAFRINPGVVHAESSDEHSNCSEDQMDKSIGQDSPHMERTSVEESGHSNIRHREQGHNSDKLGLPLVRPNLPTVMSRPSFLITDILGDRTPVRPKASLFHPVHMDNLALDISTDGSEAGQLDVDDSDSDDPMSPDRDGNYYFLPYLQRTGFDPCA